MEITGIKTYLKYMFFISITAYLLGRLFYVPTEYCYIDKVGYRSLDACEKDKRLKARMPEIHKATKKSIQLIESWYYAIYE